MTRKPKVVTEREQRLETLENKQIFRTDFFISVRIPGRDVQPEELLMSAFFSSGN